jgi:hypothetical protein
MQWRLALMAWPELSAQPLAISDWPQFSPAAVRAFLQPIFLGPDGRLDYYPLYDLAVLMGHGGPLTGFTFYFHLQPLVDRSIRSSQLPPADGATLATLAGRTREQVKALVRTERRHVASRAGAGQVVPPAVTCLETALLREAGAVATRRRAQAYVARTLIPANVPTGARHYAQFKPEFDRGEVDARMGWRKYDRRRVKPWVPAPGEGASGGSVRAMIRHRWESGSLVDRADFQLLAATHHTGDAFVTSDRPHLVEVVHALDRLLPKDVAIHLQRLVPFKVDVGHAVVLSSNPIFCIGERPAWLARWSIGELLSGLGRDVKVDARWASGAYVNKGTRSEALGIIEVRAGVLEDAGRLQAFGWLPNQIVAVAG